MIKKRYAIFTIALFALNIHTISASCTQEEINSFKRIEDKYTVKYEINKSTKTYDVYFNAPKPDSYYYKIYSNNNLECEKINDTTMKCINFPPDVYEIIVVGVTNTCNDILKTINIKLPKYNTLSEDPLCVGIEDFVLCSPTYDKEITYEEFASRVATYKKTLVKKEEEEKVKEEENKQPEIETNTLTEIIEYIKSNWLEITIIVVFVILATITSIITIKSARKSRRLE
jgi:hypothetical protein